MAAPFSLTASTVAPVGHTVELHCPGHYVKFNRACRRLLAIVSPSTGGTTMVSLSCPRCHQRTTFTVGAP